jgi:hypothetical protein
MDSSLAVEVLMVDVGGDGETGHTPTAGSKVQGEATVLSGWPSSGLLRLAASNERHGGGARS